MRRPVEILVAAAALAAVSVSTAAAQAEAPPRARSSVSLGVIQTRPLGALGRNIGKGYGIAGNVLLPLDRRGIVSLRADFGAAEYGSESKRTIFSESVGGRVDVEVRTVNAVVPTSLGLQLTLPTGPVFGYAMAGVGGQLFYTESRVEPSHGGTALASTVNQSDVAPAVTLGGGIYLPLRIGRSTLLLDLGAQLIRGGRAEYLAPGSIEDLPDGRITITPMTSSTHVVVVRLGARMTL